MHKADKVINLTNMWYFLKHEKKWWLTPIILFLLLLIVLIVFGKDEMSIENVELLF